jgi:hypothetical protein
MTIGIREVQKLSDLVCGGSVPFFFSSDVFVLVILIKHLSVFLLFLCSSSSSDILQNMIVIANC